MLRQLPFQTRVSSFPPSLPGVGWAGIKTRQKSCFYRIHTVLDASVALVVFFLSQMLSHPLCGERPCNSNLSPLWRFLALHFSSTSCLIQYLLRRQASDPFILFFTIHYYVTYSDQFKVLKRMPGQRRTTTDSFFWGKTTFLLMFIRRQAEQALTR